MIIQVILELTDRAAQLFALDACVRKICPQLNIFGFCFLARVARFLGERS
jgi:hypothetical protein